MNLEIKKLLKKKVIVPTTVSPGDFFSTIFLRIKKDNSYRMILNLKKLNEQFQKIHFKMESIQNVINMIRPRAWMASVDLKDAYFSIPIYVKHQKYLKILWNTPYKFTALPNGYGPAMRRFTKILKPPFTTLREKGHLSVVYADDTYLQGDNLAECQGNVTDTVALLRSLGFTIHAVKSVLTPTQELTFLGYIINSRTMTLTLTIEKKEKIIILCQKLLCNKTYTIREVASALGNLVAALVAVPYGKLYYRSIENEKILALKLNKGNFDKHMTLNTQSKLELEWWIHNIPLSYKSLIPHPVEYTIYTDASLLGWGATDNIVEIGGPWTEQEKQQHINVLEMISSKLALLAYCKNSVNMHIRIMSDNTTAVAYINHMGGVKSPQCNKIAKEIWTWAERNQNWISAAHIPGIENVIADKNSRIFSYSSEWMLSDKIFKQITDIYGTPEIDMFASRLNYRLPKYVSWKPDPGSIAVDAFSTNWTNIYILCFPPFSVIWKTLAKISQERVEAVLIAPIWPTQSWFPALMRMVIEIPLTFASTIQHLKLPTHPNQPHPLCPKLRMMAARLSGDQLKPKIFRERLSTYYSLHGETIPSNATSHHYKDGKSFVVNGVKIPTRQI